MSPLSTYPRRRHARALRPPLNECRARGSIELTSKLRGWPVSRILSRRSPPLDDHSSAASVTRAVKLPTRAPGVTRPCGGIPDLAIDGPARVRPLFGIAPGGACHTVPVARSVVGSYPTVSPSLLRTEAVSSLWRFPWGCPRRALPGTLASWSPDFPRTLPPAIIQPSAQALH